MLAAGTLSAVFQVCALGCAEKELGYPSITPNMLLQVDEDAAESLFSSIAKTRTSRRVDSNI